MLRYVHIFLIGQQRSQLTTKGIKVLILRPIVQKMMRELLNYVTRSMPHKMALFKNSFLLDGSTGRTHLGEMVKYLNQWWEILKLVIILPMECQRGMM